MYDSDLSNKEWAIIEHHFKPKSSQNLNFSLEHETIERDDFEKSVGRFYARLLANQEPLGAEFEAVLHKNLWDLYES